MNCLLVDYLIELNTFENFIWLFELQLPSEHVFLPPTQLEISRQVPRCGSFLSLFSVIAILAVISFFAITHTNSETKMA